jgi:Na+:H+ antiporter, NhaA family
MCWGCPLLAGIRFTVSLLIGELAFGVGSEKDEHARIGILASSLICALLATLVLRARNRHYHRLCAAEERDTDAELRHVIVHARC